MKKKIYQISAILILIILIVGIHSKAFAYTYSYNIRVAATAPSAGVGAASSNSSKFDLDTIRRNADNFLKAGASEISGGNRLNQNSIEEMIKSIYNILLVLGIMAAIIIGLILAIKFITGGLEEKAQVKEMLTPYAVGCVVIFSAFAIWKLVVDVLQAIQAIE